MKTTRKTIHQYPIKAMVLALAACFAQPTYPNPVGPTVINGNATFATSGNTLTVTNTPGAILNWQQFSIGQGQLTQFNQQSAQSSVLNRVIGPGLSLIYGTLRSNGNVYLINQAGILFGTGSVIDVNGLVASTMNITNTDFTQNQLNFSGTNGNTVLNQGSITTPSGGHVYLIGNNVTNEGVIFTPQGETALAAGNSVSLLDSNSPHVTVTLNAPVGGNAVNVGKIVAQDGSINIYGALIQQQGLLRADSASIDAAGNIVLSASNSVDLAKGSVTSANGPVGGNITVQSGATGTTVASGQISATGSNGAGGNVQVLGNQVSMAGVVDVSGSGGGKISVLGDKQTGSVNVTGILDASAPNSGNGGFIETSAAHVQVADTAKVTTASAMGLAGTWLIDPADFTIGSAAVGTVTAGTPSADISAATLSSALGLGQVTILSTQGSTLAGSGNINVNDVVTWAANTLTLNAQNNININANLNGSGTASLALQYGQGAVAAGNTSSYILAPNVQVNLPAGNNFSTMLGSNGSTVNYTVITSLGAAGSVNTTDLQGINGGLTGNYVLGSNIDATATSTWNGNTGFTPIGYSTPFTGTLDGLGHTISNLTVNQPGAGGVGLVGNTTGSSVIRNVGLIGDNVSGGSKVGGLVGSNYGTVSNSYATGSVSGTGNSVGGLVGQSGGTVSSSYATGSVSGSNNVGGLVGDNSGGGTVNNSYATGSVSGTGDVGGLVGYNLNGTISNSYAAGSVSGTSSIVGGLVGYNFGTISNSYATDSVSGTTGLVGGLVGYNTGTVSNSYAMGNVSGSSYVGGLVGDNGNGGKISNSYATGNVTGTGGDVGGLVGFNYGTVSNSYWNSSINGTGIGLNGGTITGGGGLTTAQMQTASNFTGFFFTTTPGATGNNWVIVNADGSLNNGSLITGATFPMLASEYSTTINNAHQLQLMEMALGANYTLNANINAAATGNNTDVWGSSTFFPIGNLGTPFTGTFDGLGHTISNLTINLPTSTGAGPGLFGYTGTGSVISNVGMVGGSASGVFGSGGLVGYNSGTVSNSYATGNVNAASGGSGGLVGYNFGTVSNSYATGNVSGGNTVGGLVGYNSGTVSNSYATGSVSGASWVGGLVGYNTSGSTISNGFWNSSINGNTGIGSNSGTITGGGGLTTAQMMQQASFTGWNIANTGGSGAVWRIYEGHTAPLLTSFLTPLTLTGAPDITAIYNGSSQSGASITAPSGVLGSAATGTNAGFYNGYYSTQQGYDIIGGNLTISPLAVTVVTLAGNKVYDGSTIFATGQLGISDIINGDTVSLSTGTANTSSKNVGTWAFTSFSGLALTGSSASNYTVAGVSGSGTITQLASVAWTGGASGNWSNAANWAGGAIPDLSNVAAVTIPAGVTVTYDSSVGATTLNTLTSSGALALSGGTLNIGAGGLTTPGYTQSGGTIGSSGNFTVSNNFAQTGGTITLTGTAIANITQTTGNLGIANLSAPTVNLTANSGSLNITDAQVISGGNMVVNVGDNLNLTASTAQTMLQSGGTQTINFTGSGIAHQMTLQGGNNSSYGGASASINSTGLQTISYGTTGGSTLGILVAGGSAVNNVNNKYVYVNNVQGALVCTACATDNQAYIQSNGGQTIKASTITVNGGVGANNAVAGNGNNVYIDNSSASVAQNITTTGAINLTGGTALGYYNATYPNEGDGNQAEINSGGTQIIHAGSIALSGGGGTQGGAYLGGVVSQNITTTGNLSMTGGRFIAPVAIGDKNVGNITLNVGGSLTMAGGSDSTSLALIGSLTPVISIKAANLSMTSGTGASSQIGGPAGTLSITTTTGNITQDASSVINATSLITSSVAGTTLNGANAVGSFNATNSGSGNISLTNTATPLTITGISNTGGGSDTVSNTGAIKVTENVTVTGSGTVSLSGVGVTNTATISGPGGVTINAATGLLANSTGTITNGGGAATGPINLIADTMALAGGAVTGGAEGVGLRESTSGRNINLGTTVAGTLSLLGTDFQTITAQELLIGGTVGIYQYGTGSIALSGAITPVNLTGIGNGSGLANGRSGFSFGAVGGVNINAALNAGPTNIQVGSATTISEGTNGSITTSGTLYTYSVGGQTLNGSNAVGTLNAFNSTSGDIALTNTASPLTVTGISNTGGGNVTVVNTGSITLDSTINAGTGVVTLAARGGNFVNNSGSATPITAGQWLVYSTDPALDTLGGMSGSTQYSQTYTGTKPPYAATGNWNLYSVTAPAQQNIVTQSCLINPILCTSSPVVSNQPTTATVANPVITPQASATGNIYFPTSFGATGTLNWIAYSDIRTARSDARTYDSQADKADDNVKQAKTPSEKVAAIHAAEAARSDANVKRADANVKQTEAELSSANTELSTAKTPQEKVRAATRVAIAETKRADAEVQKADAEVKVAQVAANQSVNAVVQASAQAKVTEALAKKSQAEVKQADALAKQTNVEALQAREEAKISNTPEAHTNAEVKQAVADVQQAAAAVKHASLESESAKNPVAKNNAELKLAEASSKQANAEVKQAQAEAKQADEAAQGSASPGAQAVANTKHEEVNVKLAAAVVMAAKLESKTAKEPAAAEEKVAVAEANQAKADVSLSKAKVEQAVAASGNDANSHEVVAAKTEVEVKQANADVKEAVVAVHQAKDPVSKLQAEVKLTGVESKQAEAEVKAASNDLNGATQAVTKATTPIDREVAQKSLLAAQSNVDAKQAEVAVKHAQLEVKQAEAAVQQAKTPEEQAVAVKTVNDKLAQVDSLTKNAANLKAEASKKQDEYALATEQRNEKVLESFGGVDIAGSSREKLQQLMNSRHEFMKGTLGSALSILMANPHAADIKPCGSGGGDTCIRPLLQVTALAAEVLPRVPTPLMMPTLSYLPAIQRKVAVVIGNNAYQDPDIPTLSGAVNDANAVGKVMKDKLGYEVHMVHNGTRADIIREINKVADETGSKDSVVVYYAGHGYEEEETKVGYWIPSDASSKSPSNWLSGSDINKMLSVIPAKQVILVSDSCFSGALTKEQKVTSGSVAGESAQEILGKRSVTVMSSGGEEPVVDEGKEGHSIFAWHLIDKLNKVDNYQGGTGVFDAVKEGVAQEGVFQQPQYGASLSAGHTAGGDYLFEVRKY